MTSELAVLPTLIFATLLPAGIFLLFFKEGEGSGKGEGPSYADLRLRGLGVKLTGRGYMRLLYLFCALLLIISLRKTLIARDPSFTLLGLLASFYLYWMLRPAEYVFGSVRSVFSLSMDLLSGARRRRLDRDLYSCLVVLKNLSIVQRRAPLSADVMLEKLAKCASRRLQPLFWSMLSMYRTGKAATAFSSFAASVGTPAGRAAAAIFSKLDSINPAELTEQTEALIDAMRERRVTAGHIQAQRSGVVTMTLATVTIMIAMLDFLVVVVYMDLMEMLVSAW
ncbi:MAG: hypothetical protein IJM17_08835 [Firmicutes bacterium]|nr:hypothetical protein [Bacillota bacterium]